MRLMVKVGQCFQLPRPDNGIRWIDVMTHTNKCSQSWKWKWPCYWHHGTGNCNESIQKINSLWTRTSMHNVVRPFIWSAQKKMKRSKLDSMLQEYFKDKKQAEMMVWQMFAFDCAVVWKKNILLFVTCQHSSNAHSYQFHLLRRNRKEVCRSFYFLLEWQSHISHSVWSWPDTIRDLGMSNQICSQRTFDKLCENF